jgi:hypothetical protein
MGVMKRTAVTILLGLFASVLIAGHSETENLGRSVERPDIYTAAILTPQALTLKFELGRVPGYSHPYGPAEPVSATAWAQIDLTSAVWTSIDDLELGPFQSGRDLQTATVRDDLDAFASLLRSGQSIELVHAEPIVVWVDSSRPTVAQLGAAAKDVLRANAAARRSVALPYNRFGCIALVVVQDDGSARATLIDPPWRARREWWHGPVQAALYPVKLARVGLYYLACLFAGCH